MAFCVGNSVGNNKKTKEKRTEEKPSVLTLSNGDPKGNRTPVAGVRGRFNAHFT